MSELQRERLRPVPQERGWSAGRQLQEQRSEELGPRSVGGVLDRAFEVLRANFGLLMGAGLVLCLPLRLLLFFELRPAFGLSAWGPAIELGMTTVMTTLLGALAARVFGAHIAGGDTSAWRVLGIGAGEFVGILMLSFLTGVLVGLGLLALLVGALFMTWLLALAPVVYMLEVELPPLRRIAYALKRSVSLVTGSFWRWLGLATVLGLLGLFLQGPLSQLDSPVARANTAVALGLGRGSVDLAVALLGGSFTALSAALSGIVFASFYFDQRARLEGVDLYVALRELEERGT